MEVISTFFSPADFDLPLVTESLNVLDVLFLSTFTLQVPGISSWETLPHIGA